MSTNAYLLNQCILLFQGECVHYERCCGDNMVQTLVVGGNNHDNQETDEGRDHSE